MRAALTHGAERALAVARHAGLKTLVVQDAGDQIANILFVVDDQNFRRHEQSVLAHPLRLSLAHVFCFNGNASMTSRPAPLLLCIFQDDFAAMVFHDLAHDGQPQPVPLRGS